MTALILIVNAGFILLCAGAWRWFVYRNPWLTREERRQILLGFWMPWRDW